MNPASIGNVTALQDTYFRGGTAGSLMHTGLAAGFHPGQRGNRQRLPAGGRRHRQPQTAERQHPSAEHRPFRYVGVVTEFPTAPKDSFFVANAGYVAHQTGTDAVGTFLIDTGGRDTGAVAARVRALLGTSATVTDIATTRGTVGSSLTAVNLAGLTRIELGFGLVLAAAAGALVLAFGLTERRRGFAIATALGADRRQLGSFVWAEVDGVDHRRPRRRHRLGLGVVAHARQRAHGRLRPAPTTLAVPWIYLSTTAALDVIATIGAVSAITVGLARRSPLTLLGEL